ncbi:MAG: hypothetical protein GY855_08335, partial [candidate division Zixibacteria bacterium]|nr:hypothetical protein [candidate division Zixibacteria bacterium]
MTTFLDDSTACTFLTLSVTLLIFNCGVPIHILQSVTNENLRRVVQGYTIELFRGILFLALGLLILSFALIWFLYPHPGIPLPQWSGLWSGHLMVLGLLLTFWLWRPYIKETFVEIVIIRIKDDIVKHFAINGTIPGQKAKDIIRIGQHGRPNSEKSIVLKEVDFLFSKIQNDDNYSGVELTQLLRHFYLILINSLNPGNDYNFRYAIDMLYGVIKRIDDNEFNDKSDYVNTLELIRRLSVFVAKSNSLSTAMIYITYIKESADILFEMGVSAFENSKHDVSRIALAELETLTEKVSLSCENENTIYYLGLLSYFQASDSSSLKEVADSYIRENRREFLPSLEICIEKTQQHFLYQFDYITVDNLSKMLEDLSP